jgi:hypothetical protein
MISIWPRLIAVALGILVATAGIGWLAVRMPTATPLQNAVVLAYMLA